MTEPRLRLAEDNGCRSTPIASRPSTRSSSWPRAVRLWRWHDGRASTSPVDRDDPDRPHHRVNPRARNKRQLQGDRRQHRAIGLKRPITVSAGGRRRRSCATIWSAARAGSRPSALGETEIPALVIDAAERRLPGHEPGREHRPPAAPRHRPLPGDREPEQARLSASRDRRRRSAASRSWVSTSVGASGEGRGSASAAVESGLIPLSFAVEIATRRSSEAQNILMDAYESGKIKGKKLTAIRRCSSSARTKQRLVR